MMHQDSLEPAAIRFTLECLQESARRSGYFLPAETLVEWSNTAINLLYWIKLMT